MVSWVPSLRCRQNLGSCAGRCVIFQLFWAERRYFVTCHWTFPRYHSDSSSPAATPAKLNSVIWWSSLGLPRNGAHERMWRNGTSTLSDRGSTLLLKSAGPSVSSAITQSVTSKRPSKRGCEAARQLHRARPASAKSFHLTIQRP